MNYLIELELDDEGLWTAWIPAVPGVIAHGATQEEAERNVQSAALTLFLSRDVQQDKAGVPQTVKPWTY